MLNRCYNRLCDGKPTGTNLFCDRCEQDRRPAAQDAEQDRRNCGRKGREMANGIVPPSAQPFTGIPVPEPTDDGSVATGSYAVPVGTGQGSFAVQSYQGVPSQSKVRISGQGVSQIAGGAPNQFEAMVSLTTRTLQLTGHCTNARNQNTDPATNPYVWVSRNDKVAVVSTGLVTLISQGEVDIECQYPRASNLPFTGSTPSGTECNSATLLLKVVA